MSATRGSSQACSYSIRLFVASLLVFNQALRRKPARIQSGSSSQACSYSIRLFVASLLVFNQALRR
ncbi:MAG: hypothetical protein ACNA8W_12440, partial [Bradymonadaceae bacterium]